MGYRKVGATCWDEGTFSRTVGDKAFAGAAEGQLLEGEDGGVHCIGLLGRTGGESILVPAVEGKGDARVEFEGGVD